MLVAEEAADEAPAARPKTHPGLIIPNIQFINLEGDDRAPPERLPAAIPPRACHTVKPCQLFPGKRRAAGRQEVAPSRAGEPQPWGTGWGGRWGRSGQTPNLKSPAAGRIPASTAPRGRASTATAARHPARPYRRGEEKGARRCSAGGQQLKGPRQPTGTHSRGCGRSVWHRSDCRTCPRIPEIWISRGSRTSADPGTLQGGTPFGGWQGSPEQAGLPGAPLQTCTALKPCRHRRQHRASVPAHPV